MNTHPHDPTTASADEVLTQAPDRRAAVIHADLSVTPIAAPPDGVPMRWTTAIGSMWADEIETHTWRRIADPFWSDCTGTELGCVGTGPFEMGDATRQVATRRGAVLLFGETVGLYDPVVDEWTRLDDTPFQMALPDTLAMGDQVLVARMRTSDNEYCLVGVLDLANGAWTTHRIELTPDVRTRVEGFVDAGWDIRTDGSVVLLAPAQVQRGTDAEPIAAYDPTTRSWSMPTPDDVATWRQLPTIFWTERL